MAFARPPPTTHQRVAQTLRERIRTGGWGPGQMLPGRRQLAQEHAVALGTVGRAVTTLIAEGLLRADDRRGTFVAGSANGTAPAAAPPQDTAPHRALAATVGIVAAIFPRPNAGSGDEQWPALIRDGCEHRLAGDPGMTIRFVNAIGPGGHLLADDQLTAQVRDVRLDAVVFIERRPAPALLESLAADRHPVAFAVFDPVDTDVPQVYVDSRAGGAQAARHLLGRGYERLLYFQPFVTNWTDERLAGVRLGLAAMGRAPELLQVAPAAPPPINGFSDRQRETAHAAALALLARGWQPGTGVIAPNDWTALGFMAAATTHGLEPGRDYAIIGFDDRDACEHGLTSLRPPLTELGEAAADMVLSLLRGEPAPSRVALRHRLIARSSTRAWDSRTEP